jgi:hypothetical protein
VYDYVFHYVRLTISISTKYIVRIISHQFNYLTCKGMLCGKVGEQGEMLLLVKSV